MSGAGMDPEDVAEYLRSHPAFFEQYVDLLAQIQVPHPHGGRAIPLSDRQVLALREKSRALEAKLAELIQFGEENDGIAAKVHRLALALLAPTERAAAEHALAHHLREDFAVPHVALRLWHDVDHAAAASEELRDYAGSLAHPYCGPNNGSEAMSWFGEGAAHVRSCALVPLRAGGETFGLLALGADEPRRFYPEMGTVYLERIGDMAAAALSRFH
jgi:uncharacterized protein YigA (DUF484 family)